jgi:hypothetical protein
LIRLSLLQYDVLICSCKMFWQEKCACAASLAGCSGSASASIRYSIPFNKQRIHESGPRQNVNPRWREPPPTDSKSTVYSTGSSHGGGGGGGGDGMSEFEPALARTRANRLQVDSMFHWQQWEFNLASLATRRGSLSVSLSVSLSLNLCLSLSSLFLLSLSLTSSYLSLPLSLPLSHSLSLYLSIYLPLSHTHSLSSRASLSSLSLSALSLSLSRARARFVRLTTRPTLIPGRRLVNGAGGGPAAISEYRWRSWRRRRWRRRRRRRRCRRRRRRRRCRRRRRRRRCRRRRRRLLTHDSDGPGGGAYRDVLDSDDLGRA